MNCKNCERDKALNSERLCFDCVDELLEQGFICKTSTCENPVYHKGDYCAECLEGMAEDKADGEREEKLIEKIERKSK